MRLGRHIRHCPIAKLLGIYVLGLGVVVLVSERRGRGLNPPISSLLMAAAVAVAVVSRRGSHEEPGATIGEAIAAGAATLVALLITLLGIWSSGDQRIVFLGLAATFALSLAGFAGLHLMSVEVYGADTGPGHRILLLGTGAMARAPVVLLLVVIILLVCAAVIFLLTGRALDLSRLL
jgi:hypothetical protein